MKNILVLCIDRDDDIGSKTGIKTPIIGRDKCIDAGVNLAITDPEEADSNAIFAAIRTYEELLSKGYKSEVALLSGTYKGGVDADEKIINQLKDVLKVFNADGVVIVSDGVEDEYALPIIQSIIPIISVQRVIIKHSRSIEYSYAVLAKYVKTLVYDARYSRFFLGVPGALLIAMAITFLLDLSKFVMPVLAAILGIALIIRGFDIDKSIKNLTKLNTLSSYIRIFSFIGGILIIFASISEGYNAIYKQLDGKLDSLNLALVGNFIYSMLPLLWIGLFTIFSGKLLSRFVKIKFSIAILYDVLRIIVLLLFYVPLQQFSLMLSGKIDNPFTLLSSLFIGLAITLVTVSIIYRYYITHKYEGTK